VVTGGADTQLALLGLGVTEPGTFTVVGGSFWQQTIVLSQPLIDPHRRLRTLCHTVPDRWMMEGIGFYCGLVMRWFRDAFCDAEVAQAQREGVDAYAILERKAALVPPGSNGVLGTFSNMMQADHWVHAAPGFSGFDVSDPTRSGRAECCRAIEESAAYVSRGHLEIIQELAGLSVDHLILTGGAAKGTLWPQILADTLALPVQISEIKESTALGAAIYAGVGVGVFDDPVSAAQQINRTERTVEPRPDASATYTQLYDRWRDVYARSLEISEAGLVRPLWRAPGT
jgi:autoinducer 2 (AI-2) kinase